MSMAAIMAGQGCEKASVLTKCYHCEQLDVIDTIYADAVNSPDVDTLYKSDSPVHYATYCKVDSYSYYFTRGRTKNCVYQ